MDEYTRKTNLPLLHMRVDVNGSHTMVSVQRVQELFMNLKKWADGKYELVATPSNIDIKTDGVVVVLNFDGTTDPTELIKKLEELGGKSDDTSKNGNSVDGCEEREGMDR